MTEIDLSIVIVSYNSWPDLDRCLPSLSSPTLRLETIIVDNGSDDGTPHWVSHHYPEILILRNEGNLGYGAAANLGILAARGRAVLVLNPDTVVHSGALEELTARAGEDRNALFTPKLVQGDGRVNACGMEMHYCGITTCYGLGKSSNAFQGLFEVPLVSGAAIAADRQTWLRLGGFDPHLFLYMEDTELSLRARFVGMTLWCAADAVVQHAYRPYISPQKLRWLEANRIWVWCKLLDTGTLVAMLPALLLTSLATWAFSLGRGQAHVRARAHALSDNLRRWPELMKVRRSFLQTKVVADPDVLQRTLVALPYGQLLKSASTLRGLDRVTTPLYKFLAKPLRLHGRRSMQGTPGGIHGSL